MAPLCGRRIGELPPSERGQSATRGVLQIAPWQALESENSDSEPANWFAASRTAKASRSQTTAGRSPCSLRSPTIRSNGCGRLGTFNPARAISTSYRNRSRSPQAAKRPRGSWRGCAAMSAEQRLTYVDSSAIVKLAIAEPESPALRRYLSRRRPLVCSALARTEVTRALLPAGAQAVARGQRGLAADPAPPHQRPRPERRRPDATARAANTRRDPPRQRAATRQSPQDDRDLRRAHGRGRPGKRLVGRHATLTPSRDQPHAERATIAGNSAVTCRRSHASRPTPALMVQA